MAMSELPSGWARTTLGTVADWGAGGTPSRSEPNFYGGKIPWIKSGELNSRYIKTTEESITEEAIKSSSAKIFPAGSVAIAMYGATIGKTAILGIDASTNQACAVGVPVEGLIGKEYLYRLLQNEKAAFIEKGKGGAQPNISQSVIKAHEIGLPPLAEQTRIAAKLDELLVQVDSLKARIDGIPSLLKRFRQSVLAAATSGRLTEEWRATNPVGESAEEYLEKVIQARRQSPVVKFKEPISPDLEKNDFEAPPGWMIASVSNFAECLDSMRVPVKKELRKSGEGRYPYFGANGEVDRVDEYIFDDDLVLVTEDETFYGREKPIAYKYSGKCWINNHVHALRAHDSIARDYLCYALMHYDVIPWLTGTTGRAKLTQGALLSLPIQVPPSVEQTEIVRRVEQLFAFADQLEIRLKVAQARINHLTQSILAKAFRGELVPQEPTDEPASVLLERIKAQRTTVPKTKRGRRAATLD
jgi:type I restriction enzyme S subunit